MWKKEVFFDVLHCYSQFSSTRCTGGSANSTLNLNFYLGWYKHQNYWFAYLWISPRIIFKEADNPISHFPVHLYWGSSLQELTQHISSSAIISSSIITKFLSKPLWLSPRPEELLLVKLSTSIKIFYWIFRSETSSEEISAKKSSSMGTFRWSSTFKRHVEELIQGISLLWFHLFQALQVFHSHLLALQSFVGFLFHRGCGIAYTYPC